MRAMVRKIRAGATAARIQGRPFEVVGQEIAGIPANSIHRSSTQPLDPPRSIAQCRSRAVRNCWAAH